MNTNDTALTERYLSVKSLYEQYVRSSRRDPDDVRLIAVSKGHSADAIRLCATQGQVWFGENYAQELERKAEQLQALQLKWSFIGRIQSNKIASIVKYADEIQGLAELKHAQLIARHAVLKAKTPFPVWILVNLGEEASKGGVSLTNVKAFAEEIKSECPVLSLQGLMAIPPQDLKAEHGGIPEAYEALCAASRSIGAGQASLGMSNDLDSAIAAGSNCVRVGTAIFGPRQSGAQTS